MSNCTLVMHKVLRIGTWPGQMARPRDEQPIRHGREVVHWRCQRGRVTLHPCPFSRKTLRKPLGSSWKACTNRVGIRKDKLTSSPYNLFAWQPQETALHREASAHGEVCEVNGAAGTVPWENMSDARDGRDEGGGSNLSMAVRGRHAEHGSKKGYKRHHQRRAQQQRRLHGGENCEGRRERGVVKRAFVSSRGFRGDFQGSYSPCTRMDVGRAEGVFLQTSTLQSTSISRWSQR